MHGHDHDDHQHDHTHHHHHRADEPRSQHVVLDIGDGVGALVVHTDPELLGIEVEISPADADDRRSHKEVLERRSGERGAYVLVFDNLFAGPYTLWVGGVARAREVEVRGGEIAELDWRATAPGA